MIRLLACALLAGAALGLPGRPQAALGLPGLHRRGPGRPALGAGLDRRGPGRPALGAGLHRRESQPQVDQEEIDALYKSSNAMIEVQTLIKLKFDDLVAEARKYSNVLKAPEAPIAELDAAMMGKQAMKDVLNFIYEYDQKLTDFIKQAGAKISNLQYKMATEEGLMGKQSDGSQQEAQPQVNQEEIDALYKSSNAMIEVQTLIKLKFDDLVAEKQKYSNVLDAPEAPIAELDAAMMGKKAMTDVLNFIYEYDQKLTDFIKQVGAKIADLQYQMATDEGLIKRSDGSQQEALDNSSKKRFILPFLTTDNRVLALLEELVSE